MLILPEETGKHVIMQDFHHFYPEEKSKVDGPQRWVQKLRHRYNFYQVHIMSFKAAATIRSTDSEIKSRSTSDSWESEIGSLAGEERIPGHVWKTLYEFPSVLPGRKKQLKALSYLAAATTERKAGMSSLIERSTTERQCLPRATYVHTEVPQDWPKLNSHGHPLPRYSTKYATRLARNQAKRLRKSRRAAAKKQRSKGLEKLLSMLSGVSEIEITASDTLEMCEEMKIIVDELVSQQGATAQLTELSKSIEEVEETLLPMKPQMFSGFLPELPSVKLAVDEDTRGFLNGLMGQMSDRIKDTAKVLEGPFQVKHTIDTSFLDGFKEKITSFCGHPVTVAVLVLLAQFAIGFATGWVAETFIKNPILKTLFILLGALGAMYLNPLAYRMMNDAYSFAKEHFTGKPSMVIVDGIMRPQAVEVAPKLLDREVIAKGFVKPILGFLYFVVYAKPCKGDFMEEFVTRSQGLEKLAKGAEFSLNFVTDMVHDFINALGELTGIERLKHSNSNFPLLAEYSTEVEEIMNSFRMGADYNYDNAMRLIDLEKKITKLINSMPYHKKFDKDRAGAQNLLKVLNPFLSKMSRSNYTGNGPRHVPLGISVHGNTGVGKSLVTTPLINDILVRVMPEDRILSLMNNHNDFVYSVNPSSDYWDSYTGQFVAMLDEAGHRFDSVGNPDVGCEMILRMINMVNYPLNMAHLDDKGNVNFRSKIVFVTTNRKKWDWKSMILPEAYARRFKVSLLQVPKKEYSTLESLALGSEWERKLDVTTCAPDEDGNYDLSIYEFYPWNSMTGEVKGPCLSYEEVVADCVTKYNATSGEGDRLLKFHQNRKFKSFEAVKGRFSADTILKVAAMMPQGKGDYKHLNSQTEYEAALTEETLNAFFSNNAVALGIEQEAIREMYEADIINSFTPTSTIWQKFVQTYITPYVPYVATVCESLKDFVYNHAGLIAIGSALALFRFAWPIFEKGFGEQSNDVKPVTKSSAKNAKKMVRAKKYKEMRKAIKPMKVDVKVEPMVAQAMALNANTSAMATKLYNYAMWQIYVGTDPKVYGSAICFGGRLFQMPRHFFVYFENKLEDNPEVKIKFVRCGTKDASFSVFYKDLRDCFFETERNQALLEQAEAEGDTEPRTIDEIYMALGDELPRQKSIVKFLPKLNDTLSYGMCFGALVRPHETLSGYDLYPCNIKPNGCLDYTIYSNPTSYSYAIATNPGECGVPLIRCDERDPLPKVVGQHVSGNGTRGCAMPIYAEYVEKAILDSEMEFFEEFDIEALPPPKLGEERFIVELATEAESEQGRHVADNFLEVCEAPVMRLPTNSAIRRSPLFEAWGESNYDRALLYKVSTEDGVIDPHSNARGSYSGHFDALDTQCLNDATTSYIHTIYKVSDQMTPEVLSFETAVTGNFEMKGVPRSTSLGYPFCLDSKMRGKHEYFGADGDYTLESPKCELLKQRIDGFLNQMRNGKRCSFIYADFLKDERLKKEKVKVGRSRLVSASPVDYLVLCRMYFGSFVTWMTANRVHNGVAVGVDPYGCEWQQIYDHLDSVGIKSIFGDYTKYDSSLSPKLMYKCLDVIEAFYHNSTEEDRMIRRILFEDVVNSRHIASVETEDGLLGIIYEWTGSNPSGTFLTTILNSVCNNIILRYVIKKASDRARQSRTFAEIEANMRFITYGDDNGVSMSESMSHITQGSITEEFVRIGMVYTDEEKSGACIDHRKKEDCTFLKRGFRFETKIGRMVAPLSMKTILEMAYWTKKSAMPNDVYNCAQLTLLELSLHGEKEFNSLAPRIIQAMRERINHSPEHSSWMQCLSEACKLRGQY